MGSPAASEVTRLLADLSAGDQQALARLMPLVYDELRALAARALRHERPDHTLDATALVHEAYLRLVDQRNVRWQHRAQFYGLAARMMRRVLVDHARKRGAVKRGGAHAKVALDEIIIAAGERGIDLTALDEALTRLAEFDPEQSRIVDLRFFAGLTIDETAELLGTSPATVKREWTMAKAWLRREIDRDRPGD